MAAEEAEAVLASDCFGGEVGEEVAAAGAGPRPPRCRFRSCAQDCR